MSPLAVFSIFVFVVTINALSLDKVSVQNVNKTDNNSVTKRNAGEFFPDWVPFKNKKGEELGEFVVVAKKPKKRLAPPIKFALKAVAEPQGDDYYDKGQGESEDDFEKREWSDLNRPAGDVSGVALNHTEISDIDGVVNIITQPQPNIVSNALNLISKPKESNQSSQSSEETSTKEESDKKELRETSNESSEVNTPKTKTETEKNEDDTEYEEDSNTDKKKPEITEEESADNKKKNLILESVDELKERHAAEQRAISENAKQEEIEKEEHEKDTFYGDRKNLDKYGNEKTSKRYDDYEEYEDRELSVHDKYKPARNTPSITFAPTTVNTYKDNNKHAESGKLSVFKNPHLYIVYDDDDPSTVKPTTKSLTRQRPLKLSSRYTTSTDPEGEENVRISLVPQDTTVSKDEPTLFFPKTKKNKRRRKNKFTTTSEPDSYVAETVKESAAKLTTASDYPTASGPDTTATGPDVASTGVEWEAVPVQSSKLVVDALPASSDKKDSEKKPENSFNEKGGGREHHSEHTEVHSEHGKKAYEGIHEDTKTAKGHHDKEKHLGEYKDFGGHDQHHHKESGHYGDHHHEEHGKKHAKYEESGKHSKGHSTKGSHDIHKKEEYEKKVEFFEEEGDSGEEEKHRGYHDEKEHKSGGHFKKGNLKAGHHQHQKGDSGHFHKGMHLSGNKGHHSSGGHESHGKRAKAHNEEGEKESGKKWIYHHGYPAKTANLVVIDRRADQYSHGPHYFG